MIILSPDTILNPSALETRSLPKKIIGRVQVIPKGISALTWMRLIIEMQLVRYLLALLPFLALIFVSRDLALPVTQAPLAMILVIGVVELKILRFSTAARERLMTRADADRIHDAFAFRARKKLRQIAAHHGIDIGQLRLVAEQSELARIPPLTFLSIQTSEPVPQVMMLTEKDREALQDLFDQELTEKDLHRANLRCDDVLREVVIEAESVSAHGRLAAWIDAHPAEA